VIRYLERPKRALGKNSLLKERVFYASNAGLLTKAGETTIRHTGRFKTQSLLEASKRRRKKTLQSDGEGNAKSDKKEVAAVLTGGEKRVRSLYLRSSPEGPLTISEIPMCQPKLVGETAKMRKKLRSSETQQNPRTEKMISQIPQAPSATSGEQRSKSSFNNAGVVAGKGNHMQRE